MLGDHALEGNVGRMTTAREQWARLLEGAVDAWVDGVLHPMRAGDLAAFPAGTGVAHTFINNGEREARLLVTCISDTWSCCANSPSSSRKVTMWSS